jgi:hypothetical protein
VDGVAVRETEHHGMRVRALEAVGQAGVVRELGVRVDDVLADYCEWIAVGFEHHVSSIGTVPTRHCSRPAHGIRCVSSACYRIHYLRDTFPT